MFGDFRRPSLMRSGVAAMLTLASFMSFSQDHGSGLDALSGGGASGGGGLGNGAGGAMTPMEYVAAVRAINQNYDTQAQSQQSAMVQANNEMAECALRDLENQQAQNQNFGDDNGQTGQEPSPWMNALQAALPGLTGPGMQQALNSRSKDLKLANERARDGFNNSVSMFCQNYAATQRCAQGPQIDVDGNLISGSVNSLMTECLNNKNLDRDARDLCRQQAMILNTDLNTAQTNMARNKAQMSNAMDLAMGIGTSLLTGALAYWSTNQANKSSQEGNKAAKQTSAQQSDLARKICEMNAQQAYDLAKQRLAEINRNRKNALGDLALAASIPGVKQPQNGKGDTDVPVDLGDLKGAGPSIPVGDAQNFSSLEDPNANPTAAADAGSTPAASSAAGGSGGGGSGSAPSSTFGGGPGPDRAGLPNSASAKAGNVSGVGSVIPLNGGNEMGFDPYAGFGYPGAEGEGQRGPATIAGPVPVGDGGLLKLLVMARRRYSAHAGDLVKSVDVNQLAKNAAPTQATERKVSSEKSEVLPKR